VIATNQEPANPIHQQAFVESNQAWKAAQHRSKDSQSHISPTYGLCISASGYWQAGTHASNRGFLLNANLAIKLLHLLVCSALSSADQ